MRGRGGGKSEGSTNPVKFFRKSKRNEDLFCLLHIGSLREMKGGGGGKFGLPRLQPGKRGKNTTLILPPTRGRERGGGEERKKKERISNSCTNTVDEQVGQKGGKLR